MTTRPLADQFACVWTARKNNTVAVLRCNPSGQRSYAIPVVLDNAGLARLNSRFVGVSRAGGVPQIAVTTAFLKLPRDMREAALWHEVGHIHLAHHEKFGARSGPQTQDELRAHRIGFVDRGEVMPEEREADAFAATIVGPAAVIEFLRYSLSTRPTGGPQSLNEVGRRELELRITALGAGR